MIIDMHPRLLTAALCLLLGGCASLEPTRGLDEPVAPTVANTLGESAEGRVVAVDSNEFGIDGVSTGAHYTAASGKTCKRLFNAADQQLPRVVCQSANGEWYLQRSLALAESTAQATAVVSAQPVTIVSDSESNDKVSEDGRDLVERQLQSDETLWSFAQRLTGNGLNWHQIADANGIDDARQLDANTTLLLPAGLLKAGQ